MTGAEVAIGKIGFEYAKKIFSPVIKYLLTQDDINNTIRTIASKIEEIQKVKTIWQYDKSVNIIDFYYPTKIRIDSSLIQVEEYKDFKTKKPIVIEGNVGRGKSIFLRYLAYNEFIRKGKIPIFIECRKIRTDNLMDSIDEILLSYGFPNDAKVRNKLLHEAKFALYLDGFDELSSKYTQTIIQQIEFFVSQYSNTHLVMTSRPFSDIQNATYCEVYKISDVLDIKGFITRIVDLDYSIEDLVEKIEKSGSEIQSLLRSPLLITLLVFTYRVYQEIPDQFSDFYKNLFEILLNRHDKTKAGYKRERSSNLNDIELQHIFEAFSMITHKQEKLEFTKEEMVNIFQKGLDIIDVKSDATLVSDDIQKITNLIIPIGMKYQFIHKSIQEYYAAVFIQKRDEEGAKKAYKYLLENTHINRQVLNFLEEIDAYRYVRYFYNPLMQDIFKSFGISTIEAFEKITVEDILKNEVVLMKVDSEVYNSFIPNNFLYADLSLFIKNNMKMCVSEYRDTNIFKKRLKDSKGNFVSIPLIEVRCDLIYSVLKVSLEKIIHIYYKKQKILSKEKYISDELF